MCRITYNPFGTHWGGQRFYRGRPVTGLRSCEGRKPLGDITKASRTQTPYPQCGAAGSIPASRAEGQTSRSGIEPVSGPASEGRRRGKRSLWQRVPLPARGTRGCCYSHPMALPVMCVAARSNRIKLTPVCGEKAACARHAIRRLQQRVHSWEGCSDLSTAACNSWARLQRSPMGHPDWRVGVLFRLVGSNKRAELQLRV